MPRWFCIKDTYIANMHPQYNYSIGFVMLVDSGFEFKKHIKLGAYHSIELKNLQRSLWLKFKSAHAQNEWYDKLAYMVEHTAAKYFCRAEYLLYESFAPARSNQMCKWYVNAHIYMEHVMHALNEAREEIYIADWWLCPELYLKRPITAVSSTLSSNIPSTKTDSDLGIDIFLNFYLEEYIKSINPYE
jgi:phospholipase D1/2